MFLGVPTDTICSKEYAWLVAQTAPFVNTHRHARNVLKDSILMVQLVLIIVLLVLTPLTANATHVTLPAPIVLMQLRPLVHLVLWDTIWLTKTHALVNAQADNIRFPRVVPAKNVIQVALNVYPKQSAQNVHKDIY